MSGSIRQWLCIWLVLSGLTIAGLVSDLKGRGFEVISSADNRYANASAAFNRRYTFRPLAITYPRSSRDVSEIVTISGRYNVAVSARSGGHSYIANALGGKDGAVVVDLSLFNTIEYDGSTNVATIGPGTRLGDLALILDGHGSAMPHGLCPYVGMGGHSGHGGYGFTSRSWGLTLDTVQSLDVVLANGTMVTASSSRHPDLFWALRGSSSSYGIVTSIRATTFPAPPSVTTFLYVWDIATTEATSSVLAYQDFTLSPSTPSNVGLYLVLTRGSAHGKVQMWIMGAYYGPHDDVEGVMGPLLSRLPPVQNVTVNPGTYIESVEMLGFMGRLNTTVLPDEPNTFYAKSLMTPQEVPMEEGAVRSWMKYLGDEGFEANTVWYIEIEMYGGPSSKINQIPLDTTSFGRRNTLFTIQFYTSSMDGAPPFPKEGFGLLDDMVDIIVKNSPSGWDYGTYANYIDDRLDNWQHLYYGSHYPRLQRLKSTYDPNDMFQFPNSVEPWVEDELVEDVELEG
ncbi:glucooligosaccharide oxidase [Panaeolus papilionaceus]|nr:glucooligosaccharide oxidase [Panaeolus papilionaceus]